MDFLSTPEFADILDVVFHEVDVPGYYALIFVSTHISEKIMEYTRNNVSWPDMQGLYKDPVEECLRSSDVDLALWLHEYIGFSMPPRIYNYVATGPAWDTLFAWLKKQQNVSICSVPAISAGNLEAFEYILSLHVQSSDTGAEVLKSPHRLKMLDLMIANRASFGSAWMALVKSRKSADDREVITRLLSAGHRPPMYVIQHAASIGQFARMEIMCNILQDVPDIYKLGDPAYGVLPRIISYKDAQQIAMSMIQHGKIDAVDRLTDMYGKVLLARYIFANTVPMFEYLLGCGLVLQTECFRQPILTGNTRVIEYLIEKGCPVAEAAEYAAEAGNIDLLKRLELLGAMKTTDAVCEAVKRADYPMLEWMVSAGYSMDSWQITEAAITADNLELLQWLVDNAGIMITETDFHAAAEHDITRIFEWLMANHLAGADLDMIRRSVKNSTCFGIYLKYMGYPTTLAGLTQQCIDIVRYGDFDDMIDLLDWSISNEITTDGHRTNQHVYGDTKWSQLVLDELITHSAGYGNFQTLDYLLYTTGTQPTYGDFMLALSLHHPENMLRLLLHYHDGDLFGDDLISIAVKLNKIGTVKWLHKKGAPLTARLFKNAYRLSDYGILKWLIKTGCPVPSDMSVEHTDAGIIVRKYAVSRNGIIVSNHVQFK